MKILGSIRWLKIRLEVSVAGHDGTLPVSPWLYLAFSEYNKRVYGYKIFLSHQRNVTLQNIYECAPLSRVPSWLVPEYLAADSSADSSAEAIVCARLTNRYYRISDDWLESEFECEFYKWPFWACGAKPNIYNASILDLDTIVRRCIRRINRAQS